MRRPVDVKAHFRFLPSLSLFPFSRAASVAILPSALFCERYSLGAGGCSRFSRCCYLIIDLSSHLFGGSGPQELAVGTPLISLGPALVGNSLCRGQEERTMRETEVQIGKSGLSSALHAPNPRSAPGSDCRNLLEREVNSCLSMHALAFSFSPLCSPLRQPPPNSPASNRACQRHDLP